MDQEANVGQLIEGLIEREGGYANHPADKGGATCFGITEAVARAHGYTGGMRDLPRDEAAAMIVSIVPANPVATTEREILLEFRLQPADEHGWASSPSFLLSVFSVKSVVFCSSWQIREW